MKKFLEKLSAPGVDIPAPGGDTKGPWTKVIAKGPKKARSLPMEYTDKRSVARGGGAGPGNAWTPPQNPLTKTIERGHFFKLVWQCAYAFDDLKRKCKHNVESHTKWQARFSGVNDVVLAQPAVDTACCCPVPCMAGTIAAIASCASLAGSWFDPRGVTWMCMAAATYNVSKHRIMVKRFEDWVSQKKKFGCWEKKTDTRMPYPESENVLRPVPEHHTLIQENMIKNMDCDIYQGLTRRE